MKSDREKLDEVHEAVIELRTTLQERWNGGPGRWPVCECHSKTLEKLDKRMNWVLKTIWVLLGVVLVKWGAELIK